MAAVFAPLDEIERILKTIDGYVVIANVNSDHQAVIGGASEAVEQAMEVLQKAGYDVCALPVSHAFHTSIVAPASEPLRKELAAPASGIAAPADRRQRERRVLSHGPGVVPQMLDLLARQVASPVQFVKGLRTLYDAGARVFVEVGPKKALQGFAEDVLGDRGDVVSLFTNHPKFGDIASFNQALCGLYAAGLGRGTVCSLSRRKQQRPVQRMPVASPRRLSLLRARQPSAPRTPQAPRRTAITTPNSAASSPMFSSAAGRFITAKTGPSASAPVGRHHRSGFGPARNRAHLR